MNNERIKISVITVCLNSEKLIEKTIQSVINQKYSNIEYIIIDGGSTDNTLNIIEKYNSHINVLVSEKDDGIYYAMNKGIKLATGDLIYFLNCGDYLYNNSVFEAVAREYAEENLSDIIYGDIICYEDHYSKYYFGPRNNIVEIIPRGINHQSMFTKKNVFEKCGCFDTEYKIFSDFDWLLRCIIQHKINISKMNIPIAYYLMGGVSEKHIKKFMYEKYEIIAKYTGLNHLLRYSLSHPFLFSEYMMYIISNRLSRHLKLIFQRPIKKEV